MPDETTLPEDENDLAQLYQETIDTHRAYLDRLHTAFDARCDEIGAQTKKKLEGVDESDEETRKQIMAEEQEQLNKILAELKFAINKSNADARQKLEEIQTKLEEKTLNLEEELANV